MVDASHPLLCPERCSWSGDSERASRSAVWASLPAPDNFTIPVLAGGDNHIKLPWQEALNSAPVPLRVWHPAVSPEHAADVQWEGLCLHFFTPWHRSFFYLPPPPKWANDLGFHVTGAKIWIGRIECYCHCPVRSVIVLAPSVCHGELYTISSFGLSGLRNIFEKFSWEIASLSMLFGISVDIQQLSPSNWSKHCQWLYTQNKRLRTVTLPLCWHGFTLML